MPELKALAPSGARRMGANPHANGGILLRDLRMPDFTDHAVDVPKPGTAGIGDTHVVGRFLRDVLKLNAEQRNFQIFGPDRETLSNGLEAVFEATNRQWLAATRRERRIPRAHRPGDGNAERASMRRLARGSTCLTGRPWPVQLLRGLHPHRRFDVQSACQMAESDGGAAMAAQDRIPQLPAELARLAAGSQLASPHQDQGFIDRAVNKEAEVRARVCAAGRELPALRDGSLPSQPALHVNVVIARKHPAPQWLSMDAAVKHCTEGIGIWQWASNDNQGDSGRGDGLCRRSAHSPKTLAAVSIMRERSPALKIRVVNVVDLMKLQPHTEHPHGLSDYDFDSLFTRDKPVIFAFHAYPWLIHRLTYRRRNHANLHVRGYKEEGTITTPFDMTVLNDLDRFHLVIGPCRQSPAADGQPGAST